ncbi:hypothetical protein SDC9_174505 [bioreactor metagenome]|uniref:Uncharacterized protein n=1 Tax=bioreactor metagenome TaxID=1076179 RepID=A0A645GJH1_9ZZZZ
MPCIACALFAILLGSAIDVLLRIDRNMMPSTSAICATIPTRLLFFIRAVPTVSSVPSSAPTMVGSAGISSMSTTYSG